MAKTRSSKQKQAVLLELQSRCDHPTAEEVFFKLKTSLPALSLATVYRNLHTLESEGKVISIKAGGCEHFDANLSNHCHLTCEKCGRIFDVKVDSELSIDRFNPIFDGSVNRFSIMFYGMCAECESKQSDT